MGVFVIKADGSRQDFDKAKVVQTCLRLGVSSQVAFAIAERIEKKVYDGISTKTILRLIFKFTRSYKPDVRHIFDLKRGLSLMTPQPEFELFIQTLLAHQDFEVEPNQILMGRCVGHEVDAIAKKDGITYFVEVKHHYSYHAKTGLDESRIARAVFEDVTEGYALGKNSLKIDYAMIITNTRYSTHAAQYGRCRNILQIGWNSPDGLGLQKMIEDKKLHPLSCLKGINSSIRARLVNSGIVLISQLLDEAPLTLRQKTGLPQATLNEIITTAQSGSNVFGHV